MLPSKVFFAEVKDLEALKLVAYYDDGGVLTIGWGSTRNVREGQTITVADAEMRLRADTAEAVSAVNGAVTVRMTQNEFDALCLLAFNIGGKAFTGSTLVKHLNQDDRLTAAMEFQVWSIDNGKRVKGLLRRRFKEARLFLS